MTWTLRQRRYRALAVLMLVIAIACVSIGTFELHRFREKVHGNDLLRANAHAPTSALTPAMVRLTGQGAPQGDSIKFCRVSITGRYDVTGQEYVAEQNQGGHQGFWVLTPLRTATGVLLVARGFIPATSDETRPASVPAPPSGAVRVVGRLYPGQDTSDRLGELGHGEITSINPSQQASRLGAPVYQAYLALAPSAPGIASLTPLPQPDLSNPTGGAGEIQLLSYVVQWYVFALLALLAPFFFARNDVKDAQRRYLGIDPDAGEFDALPPQNRAALTTGGSPSGVLVHRDTGELVWAADTPRAQRAKKLADRYGRTLGPDADLPVVEGDTPLVHVDPVRRDNSSAPWRASDAVHGSYNDYLWQLALADGEAPDVDLDGAGDETAPDNGTKAGDGLKVYGPRRKPGTTQDG